MSDIEVLVDEKCEEIAEMLKQKNRSYGGSVFRPLRCFSDSERIEQVNVRIDDKLSRLKRGEDIGEDDVKDLVGYLILRMILVERDSEDEQ